MTARRKSLSKSLRSAAVCAVAVWVTTWSWHAFSEASARFVVPLALLGAVIALIGGLGRWARTPAVLILAAQVLVGGALADLMTFGAVLPIGSAGRHAARVFNDAVTSANTYTPPVPATAPSMAPILIMAGLGCLIVIDFVAESWGKVAVAGLGLLAMYTVPITVAGAGPTWVLFSFVAAAYLWLLFLHENDELDRWGRSLEDSHGVSDADYRQGWVSSSSAAGVGSVALVVAIVLPWFIPSLHLGLGGFGRGEGSGDRVTVVNPITDLRRDLERGDNVPLVVVRTSDDPAPSYLRISVLNRFLNNQWSSGNRQIPDTQLAHGELPPLPGLAASVPRVTRHYQASATDNFASTWLPVGELATSVTARGDWRYDLNSRDFIAGDRSTSTAGESWSYTDVAPRYDLRSLVNAEPGGISVPTELTALPPNFPISVTQTALEVTADGNSQFEKAVMLQDWFRSDFEYSLAKAPSGNGADTLAAFIDPVHGRVGYCEQFASAMAAMARALGIPARVAVGFLNSHQTGPDTYTYYSNDMHAWAELYFPGSGWVRFEPTPATRASAVPSYTTAQLPRPNEPSVPTFSASTDDPRHTRTASPSQGAQQPDSTGTSASRGPVPWVVLGGVLAGLLLLGVAALTPGWWRRRRRARRLASGDPEAVWLELHDTCVDLGIAWPPGRSPRAVAAVMSEHFGEPAGSEEVERPAHGPGTNPTAVSALEVLVGLIERSRYAATPPVVEADVLAERGEECVTALLAGATRARRRRAAHLPRSLWLRRPKPAAGLGLGPSPEAAPVAMEEKVDA